MSDIFIVRARRDGWEIVRKPDGSLRRVSIARGIRTWTEVLSILDEASAAMGGYAWPEQRTLRSDLFSLRTEPEFNHDH